VATRNKILHAAREVFSEMGYESATFKDIAERAEVTRTNVNHYFRNKEELYQTLFEATRRRVVAVGLAEAGTKDDMVDRLSTFLRAAVQVDSDDRTYARFIASSLFDSFRNPQFQGRAQGQLDDVRRFVADSLEGEVAKGSLRPDLDVEAVTEMLVALMWGISMYAGFLGTHEQLESVVDQIVRLLSGTLW
jgi:AcrR family transcriptional regulator